MIGSLNHNLIIQSITITQTTVIKMSSQYCLYIPVISTSYLEDDIKRIFDADIGKVVRVDFAPAKSRPGQGKNVPNIIRSAYVYISCFYRTRLAANIRSTVYGSNRGFRFTLAPREYWVLLRNRNPIPSCDQNIHQLSQRLRAVESLARSQQETIDSLQKSLLAQAKYGDRMLDVIVEMLEATTDEGPFPDIAKVYSKYNYIRFAKDYGKRWLLTHDDDGDTINQAKRNDAEIADDTSTINSELSCLGESSIQEDYDEVIRAKYSSQLLDSDDDDAIAEEEESYINYHIRPQLFGRTVQEEYRANYAHR